MTRDAAIARAAKHFDDGTFLADLSRRVAYKTTSQEPENFADLGRYLSDEIGPCLAAIGYSVSIFENPVPKAGPYLIAKRIENPSLPTVFTYGHGDVIRGLEPQWRDGLSPWRLERQGDVIYGRGTADN